MKNEVCVINGGGNLPSESGNDEKFWNWKFTKLVLWMLFSNEQELAYFTDYAREKEFGVMTMSLNVEKDGYSTYLILTCEKSTKVTEKMCFGKPVTKRRV